MADGQGEAAWGTSGQVYTDNIVILQFKNLDNLCLPNEMFTPFNSQTIYLGLSFSISSG